MKTSPSVVALALLAAALGGCGGGSNYVTAVSAYAKVNGASVEALAAVPAVAVRLCQRDAQLKFLKLHLPASFGLPVEEKTPWRKWYDADRATESTNLTWRAYCDEVAEAGQGFRAALDVLAAHAGALSSLAGEKEYDGENIKTLLKASSGLANAPRETPAGRAIGGVASPVAGLGRLLLNPYKGRTIRQSAREADPHVQLILAGLAKYVSAAEALLQEAEKHQNDAFARLESVGELYKDPVDPLRVAQFYAFVTGLETEVREARATLAGFQDVIRGLQQAQREVARGRDEG